MDIVRPYPQYSPQTKPLSQLPTYDRNEKQIAAHQFYGYPNFIFIFMRSILELTTNSLQHYWHK